MQLIHARNVLRIVWFVLIVLLVILVSRIMFSWIRMDQLLVLIGRLLLMDKLQTYLDSHRMLQPLFPKYMLRAVLDQLLLDKWVQLTSTLSFVNSYISIAAPRQVTLSLKISSVLYNQCLWQAVQQQPTTQPKVDCWFQPNTLQLSSRLMRQSSSWWAASYWPTSECFCSKDTSTTVASPAKDYTSIWVRSANSCTNDSDGYISISVYGFPICLSYTSRWFSCKTCNLVTSKVDSHVYLP